DPDGDAVKWAVQYSADNGQTWRTLATDITQSSYEADLDELPGTTQARLRVIGSDGVNTDEDDSDGPFTVPDKPPQALITAPANGARLPAGERIALAGEARDLEDGPLADEALTWSSNRDGPLGTGRDVSVTLSAGTHVITLSATDSALHTATAAVTLVVFADCNGNGVDD